jgi:hypothetical protein
MASEEVSGSICGSRHWLDPDIRFLFGKFHQFHPMSSIGSFEEVEIPGIFYQACYRSK